MNDCTNGNIYVVRVTSSFRLITPILGEITASSFTLGATSEATVVEDAFDPTGLEVLVWVDKANSENGSAIAKACIPADAIGSPGFYYAPCQDKKNQYNYLQYQEGEQVRFKVRVANTGNVLVSSLGFTFAINGKPISTPSSCSGLGRGPLAPDSAPVPCTFTEPVAADSPEDGVSPYVVTVRAQGVAEGLPTGWTSGSATINVVPPPRLVVNLKAARYRLGGDGNGVGGTAQYPSGDLTLDRTADRSSDRTLREPVGWLKVNVKNEGGIARNFDLEITEDGDPISLAGSCTIPNTLGAAGSPTDNYTCIVPQSLDRTTTYDYRAVATARNAQIIGGDPTVEIRTRTCSGSQLVVPNLVDRLNPLLPPDGSRKTVGQARALWQDAGFSGPFRTTPSSAGNGDDVLTQDVDAYGCEDADQGVRVDTR